MNSYPQYGSRPLMYLDVVRMQDRFDTDIDDVWSALTDPLRLARWVAEVAGDLRLGGEFYQRMGRHRARGSV